MAAMKANKEHIITSILTELEKGSTHTATKSAVICGELRLSDRTFDKYWKIAQERYAEAVQSRQTKLRSVSDAAAVTRLKKAILTREEALEILSKTAKGEVRRKGKTTIIPSHSESTTAIRTMAEMEGWNAPVQQEIGIHAQQPPLAPEERMALIEKL